MGVKFKNNASTTLSSAVNNSVTTIPVVSGAVFPTLAAGDHTYVTLATSDNSKVEVMKCTAINSNNLTVVRGQDGTSAQAFDSGDKAEGRLTVAGLNDLGNDLTTDSFTGDGSDTTFTLSTSALEANTFVFLDGVYQQKSTYSVSNATPAVVTFSTAPPNTVSIEVMTVRVQNTIIGAPSDDTVSTAKIQNNAVTTAKIADDAVTQAKIADDAVGADQLAASAVVTASMVDNAVTTVKITNGAVTAAKLATGAGGAFNDFTIKTSAYTAVTRDQIIVNSGSATTITLPSGPAAGNVVFIKATGGGTVTVGRNSSKINSTADDGELASGSAATLVYVNATIGWLEL